MICTTLARLCFCLAILGVVRQLRGDEAAKPSAGTCLVYVGTYTGEKSQGIYAYRLDLASGKCKPLGLVAEVKSPSFLAVHPNRRFLYSINEINDFDGKPTGGVSAFAIDSTTGMLKFLNHQSSKGAGPCHLVVDKSGQTVLVANYGGGSVAALPIAADGSLSPAVSAIQHKGSSVNPARQKEPHAHSINVDPGNRFAVAADLGLDKLLVYRFDSITSKLSANDPPWAVVKPGSGPRHFAFHPSGKFGYVINEILCTVTAFSYDGQRGQLIERQTIATLPTGVQLKPEYSTAEVQVHPSGKFVYGSNRGHDSITVFAVDDSDGTLRYVENKSTQGKTPRGFGIDPSGQLLLAGNQDSHTVVVFRIDPQTGRLTPTGQTLEVGSPVCVKFVMP
ncbi:MAG: lactonase family protein [Planctomycetia bacterium]|nr:lactonase family protein [Planctomycetia bacterium]